MGVCDSSNSNENTVQNNDTFGTQNSMRTGKYFSQNNISKPDSLILNNNVIVSETTHDL